MEHLSRLVNLEITQSNWTLVGVTKKGPHISHTLFIDDVFLFAEETTKNACIIMDVLNDFFASSGLNMNTTKSKIFF